MDISTIPKLSNSLPMIGNSTQFDKTMAKEKALLQHAFEAMTNADLNCFTWSFYYVSESELDLHAKTQAVSQLLPHFYEKTATAAMVKLRVKGPTQSNTIFEPKSNTSNCI